MGACDCPSVVLPHARPSQACPGYVCGYKKKKKEEAKFSSQNTGAKAEAKSWDKFPPTSTGGKTQETKTEEVDHREAWRLWPSKRRPWELRSSS